MNDTIIRYGGQELNLRKSDRLIALQAREGMTRELARSVTSRRASETGLQLDRFSVVDVAEATEPMESCLDAMRTDAAVAAGSHVYYTSDDAIPFVPTGQIYVVFDDDADLDSCQTLIDEQQLEVLAAPGERELILQVTSLSGNPIKVTAQLQESSFVLVAEPDLATQGKLSAFTLPSDALITRQWHVRNTGFHRGTQIGLKAGADARVVDAWEAAEILGESSVVVGVIDDGFDLGHPDLSGPGKIVAPWDFTRNAPDPIPGPPFFHSGQQRWIGDWHGTACAGVAVGNANGIGVVGAAPDCRFMPVRWGIDLSDAQVVDWFDFVRVQGAAVVSCSWGAAARNFPLSTLKKKAIARCARDGRNNLGCVICFAAGNENRDINDPASGSVNGFAIHPDVVAVAACTSRDEKSHYSNFGTEISVCAPSNGRGGMGIATTDVRGTFVGHGRRIESGYSPGAFTDSFGGTSSACPLVAGVCGLLLSIKPDQTAKEVKELIQTTARKIGPAASYDAKGHSVHFGFGCVDAREAAETLLMDAPGCKTARKPASAVEVSPTGGRKKTATASKARKSAKA